jgi:hypothetical protein
MKIMAKLFGRNKVAADTQERMFSPLYYRVAVVSNEVVFWPKPPSAWGPDSVRVEDLHEHNVEFKKEK